MVHATYGISVEFLMLVVEGGVMAEGGRNLNATVEEAAPPLLLDAWRSHGKAENEGIS